MEKFLVTIEFRHNVIPKSDYHTDAVSREVTIGVYDNIDDAVNNGNNALNKLKKYFPINECFSKNGGAFGGIRNLIVDWSHKKTKASVYCKITKLHYDDLESVMEECVATQNKYDDWRKQYD